MDNMIVDILNDQLNDKLWDVVPRTKCKKRKTHAKARKCMPINNFTIQGFVEYVNNLTTKVQIMEVSVAEKAKARKCMPINNFTIQGFVEYVNNLTTKVQIMEVSVAEKVSYTLEASIYVQMEARMGNSTVKRITTGETASKEPYDPLAKVKPEKLQKVLDFIKPDLKKRSLNIAASMLMFHRRSMQSQSPYSSSRIAFLDRCFVNSWVNDYKNLVVYIGNSTVKRITTGETASKEPYDPLAKVKPEKLQKVLDFIKPDLKKRSLNIAASMLMFHRRSMQSQSPYSSSRIAFLDRCFVNSWVNDYKKYDQ
ncbi:hypothetical protein DY000_02048345 [Brassica cretica]|uniref:Uncharacterized protein n=1 Tax=Brassica cretica TaxID=69181 RepID=A0ABQ7ESV2_BRACR|nr:hypothetical protein DY000_02048345 [Brassica cretica]